MTTATPSVLAAAAASLNAALTPAVYTGAAPSTAALPYVVVLQPQETESILADKQRQTAPTDVVVTCRVWGTLATCEETAALAVNHLLTPGAVVPAGRRVVASRLAQNLPVPAPPSGTDSAVYGRQIAVRFTVHPTA